MFGWSNMGLAISPTTGCDLGHVFYLLRGGVVVELGTVDLSR